MAQGQRETSQKAAHSFCCLILKSLDHQTYSATNKQDRLCIDYNKLTYPLLALWWLQIGQALIIQIKKLNCLKPYICNLIKGKKNTLYTQWRHLDHAMLRPPFGACQEIYVKQGVHFRYKTYTNHTYLEPSHIRLKNMSSLKRNLPYHQECNT